MRIRRHAPQQEETGIDLAPMQRTVSVMNLLIGGRQVLAPFSVSEV